MQIIHLSPLGTTETAAQFLSDKVRASLAAHHSVFLLLSGGSWVGVYREMVPLLEHADLSRLTVGLVDERSVPVTDPASNAGQIIRTGWVDMLKDAGATWLPMCLSTDESGPQLARHISAKYEKILSSRPYVISTLGIGNDGHTAGILPYRDPLLFENRFTRTGLVTYYDLDPSATGNPYRHRLTITVDFFTHIDEIVVYAVGMDKLPVLRELTQGTRPVHEFPARLINQHGRTKTILTDQQW